MLTFEQKLAIIESFPELERKDVSLNRVNFHYEESRDEKKNVIYHLHPNGNGFVYARFVKGFKKEKDPKGMVNIRDYSEDELRGIIEQSIESLAPKLNQTSKEIDEIDEIEGVEWIKNWIDSERHSLVIKHEDEMWNVYAGDMLDGTFPSYNEAKQYLDEEGFRPA
jgi:hypothetical protein